MNKDTSPREHGFHEMLERHEMSDELRDRLTKEYYSTPSLWVGYWCKDCRRYIAGNHPPHGIIDVMYYVFSCGNCRIDKCQQQYECTSKDKDK